METKCHGWIMSFTIGSNLANVRTNGRSNVAQVPTEVDAVGPLETGKA